MSSGSLAPIRPHERIAVLAERFPWSALYRIVIGYLTIPLYARLLGSDGGWGLIFWFVCLLVALRVLPVILRRVLPFSNEVTTIWAERRMLAKRFDSYQWQKLFWFGIGLSIHALASGQFSGASAALTAFCLVGGGLGLLIWRQRSATRANPSTRPGQRAEHGNRRAGE